MPTQPPRFVAPGHEGREARRAHLRKDYDRSRGSRHKRGYTLAWLEQAAAYRREHPFCVFCLRDNPHSVNLGDVVDHVIPHKGDQLLFWDERNWQTLCKGHHDGEKQRIEQRAASTGEDIRQLCLNGACR